MRRIFEKEPTSWGLRGDIHLWSELKNYMLSAHQPIDVEEFDLLLEKAFKEISGRELMQGQQFFIKRFDTGGMSSGHIDSDFWIETGFPLLRKRFSEIKNE